MFPDANGMYETASLYETGVLQAGTEQDAAYREWLELMRAQEEVENQRDPYSSAFHFWIIVRVDKDKYSERIEFHPELPMLVPKPKEGDIFGIARTLDEVSQIITPDPKKERDYRGDYVYLIYKARIRNFLSFLEFLAKNGMLEREQD